MPTYTCEKCRKECEPRLWESGAGSSCCEAQLMTRDACQHCGVWILRELTADEHRALTEQMAEEQDAEMTPAERRHARVMGDS